MNSNRDDMDNKTFEFYDHYASQGAIGSEAAHSAVSQYFARAFKAGGRVLDVGAGSGRDLAVLRQMGFDAYGLEPNDTMRAFALRTHPELAGRLQAGALPAIGVPFGSPFDGIVCSAVLMHISQNDLPRCAQSLRALLNPGGRVLFTLPSMRADLLNGERDPDGRIFNNHTPEELTRHLGAVGLSFIGNWDNGEHANTRWLTLLFELPGG